MKSLFLPAVVSDPRIAVIEGDPDGRAVWYENPFDFPLPVDTRVYLMYSEGEWQVIQAELPN